MQLIACSKCGAPVTEDLQVFLDSAGAFRQWRCWNGHSTTIGRRPASAIPSYPYVCETCGREGLSFVVNTRRHPGCKEEFERERHRAAYHDLASRRGDCV